MLKAVFHIDELEKWNLLLKNAENFVHNMEQSKAAYRLEVVANSEAVRGYLNFQNSERQESMEALAAKGVQFAVCNNALKSQGLEKSALFSFVEVVPAGVVELAMRQSEGFAYIKP